MGDLGRLILRRIQPDGRTVGGRAETGYEVGYRDRQDFTEQHFLEQQGRRGPNTGGLPAIEGPHPTTPVRGASGGGGIQGDLTGVQATHLTPNQRANAEYRNQAKIAKATPQGARRSRTRTVLGRRRNNRFDQIQIITKTKRSRAKKFGYYRIRV